jgi:hypothetical protein
MRRSFIYDEEEFCRHHDYRLDYERYFLGGKFQNSKLFCHFYYNNLNNNSSSNTTPKKVLFWRL